MRAVIIGAGVIGLSVAHELSGKGADVTVVADRTAEQSVSSVAGALWFPYRSGASPHLITWLSRARERFERIADEHPEAGVDLREGVVVERGPAGRDWTAAVPRHREATVEELPPGATSGVHATVPVIDMGLYLAWLRDRVAERNVGFSTRTVHDLGEIDGADVIVVAAGLRSGELLGDDAVYPVRGQIVRLRNPGLKHWISDDDHPEGLTYILPRRDDIVCGGIAEVGDYGTGLDPATESDILRRSIALMPELAGLPVVSRAAGLRPARDEIRLERVDGHGTPVVTCYGHGGSGVTLSWGCAEAAADLAVQ